MYRVDAILGGGGVVDFSRDVRPWLGKEAAFALLNTTGSSAGSLIVLDVSRPAAARAFLTRSGAVAAGADGRVALLRYPSGAELAFIGHYLVLGQDASVRAAVAVAAGGAGSFAPTRAIGVRPPANRLTGSSMRTSRPPACAGSSPRAPGCSAHSGRCCPGRR
jgi:hypothetical protein